MHISLAAEEIFHIGPIPVTNSMLLSWLVAAFFIIFSAVIYYAYDRLPIKLRTIIEMVLDGIVGFFESVAGKKGREFFPLLGTFFLYITLSNWIGIFPGVGTIGLYHEEHGHEVFTPLFRGPTADLNTTIALAVVSVIATQVYSIKYLGLKGFIGRFISKNPIMTIVGILEIFSEFSKILSFSFRLFGNIFAGEVLLTVILALLPFVAPIPFLGLEVFVGFMQALVFTMLSLIFLTIATAKHGH